MGKIFKNGPLLESKTASHSITNGNNGKLGFKSFGKHTGKVNI